MNDLKTKERMTNDNIGSSGIMLLFVWIRFVTSMQSSRLFVPLSDSAPPRATQGEGPAGPPCPHIKERPASRMHDQHGSMVVGLDQGGASPRRHTQSPSRSTSLDRPAHLTSASGPSSSDICRHKDTRTVSGRSISTSTRVRRRTAFAQPNTCIQTHALRSKAPIRPAPTTVGSLAAAASVNARKPTVSV